MQNMRGTRRQRNRDATKKRRVATEPEGDALVAPLLLVSLAALQEAAVRSLCIPAWLVSSLWVLLRCPLLLQ